MKNFTLVSLSIAFASMRPAAAQQPQFIEQELPFVGQVKCVVDMNGDLLDDIVKVSPTAITVVEQTASGFTVNIHPCDTANHTPSWSIAAGDLDGNGYNDLLYGGGSGTSFMVANNNGTSFTEITGPEYVFSQRTNFVDINNDGHLDAFVCHDTGPNVYYINDGSGSLTFNQGGIGDTFDGGNYGSLWVDHDNDGDLDVFLSKCRGGDTPANINQLHRNNGDGTFTDIAPELGLDDNIQTWSTAWGDYDNDGDFDMMVGAFSLVNGGHKLIRNDNGVYNDVTAGSGFDLVTATSIENVTHDFNNDGFLDIFGAGGTFGAGVIMVNNGDMTFSPVSVPMNHGPIGDLNNDGFLDVMNNNIAHFGVDNGNKWIKLNMIGTASNYNGIGARVELTSALGTQMREVRSGDGFAFMSSLNLHFGLGQDTEVEQIVVRWPSGTVDILYDQPVNSTLAIVEGSTGVNVSVEEIDGPDIVLHPVPATDMLHISTAGPLGPLPAWIFDMNGRFVAQLPILRGSIDIGDLHGGAYVLYLSHHGQLVRRKFVKI